MTRPSLSFVCHSGKPGNEAPERRIPGRCEREEETGNRRRTEHKNTRPARDTGSLSHAERHPLPYRSKRAGIRREESLAGEKGERQKRDAAEVAIPRRREMKKDRQETGRERQGRTMRDMPRLLLTLRGGAAVMYRLTDAQGSFQPGSVEAVIPLRPSAETGGGACKIA